MSKPARSILFACLLCTSVPAFAQVRTPDAPPKDPGRARVLSFFIPGGGQLYAGERGKGLFLLAGSSAAVAGGFALSNFERDYDYTCSSNNCYDPDVYDPDYTPLIVGAGLAGALWLYGLIDASSAARRANRKHGRLASVHVAPAPRFRNGMLQPGLSVRLTF